MEVPTTQFRTKGALKPISVRVGRFKVKWLPDSAGELPAWVAICYSLEESTWRLLPGCELVTSLATYTPVSELVCRAQKIALFLGYIDEQGPSTRLPGPWCVGGIRQLTEMEPVPADIDVFARDYLNKLEKLR